LGNIDFVYIKIFFILRTKKVIKLKIQDKILGVKYF